MPVMSYYVKMDIIKLVKYKYKYKYIKEFNKLKENI